MDISVIVPTFNEGPNVAELVRRTTDALLGRDVEIIFVYLWAITVRAIEGVRKMGDRAAVGLVTDVQLPAGTVIVQVL